jgi:prevent-host-death family protein
MQSVGIRELKNRLTHYLRAVQQGRGFIVTARGKPVARLVPISPQGKKTLSPELEERMWELVAEGFLSWNGGGFQLPEPAAVNRGPGLLSDLVVEDRE